MAHFAKIVNNLVTDVIVVNNDVCGETFPESEPIGQAFIASLGMGGVWLQTSYNKTFRRNYAKVGVEYRFDLDIFLELKPFPSFTLDSQGYWNAPKPRPNDEMYSWNETLQKWEINE